MNQLKILIYFGILTVLFISSHAIKNDSTINLDLSSLNRTNNVYKIREIIHGPTTIHLENVYDFAFFIIQVHSFANPVYLSRFNNSNDEEESVNGTNIGFVQIRTDVEFDYSLNGSDHTHILIVIVGYDAHDPIPGACNLTFETEDAPYAKLSYTNDLIKYEVQAPGLIFDLSCEIKNITIDFYHSYLEEQDFTSESYFNGIERMLTPEDLIRNGRKLPKVYGLAPLRRYFVNYQGVGGVYGIVVEYNGAKAAYIPAVSYGCDIKSESGCSGPITTLWRIMCGIMTFYGLFLCFLGHRFFQFNLFCTGFMVSSLFTYIAVSYSNLSEWETVVTLAVVGAVYGGLWLLIWWKLKIPLLSVTLTYFLAGMLIAGAFYYSGPADFNLFRHDTNFWSVLIGISLLITILLLIISHLPSNVIATSFIGAYIFIIPFDLFIGGTLRYIFLNVIHRATIGEFKWAIVDPPYQSTDLTLMISMLIVALLGMYYQWRYIKGRAPFPPANVLERGRFGVYRNNRHYSNNRRYNRSENAPLLRNGDGNVYGVL